MDNGTDTNRALRVAGTAEDNGGKPDTPLELPSNQEIEAELWRTREQGRRHDTARNIVFALAAVFAASVLLSLFVFPIFQVYGVSM